MKGEKKKKTKKHSERNKNTCSPSIIERIIEEEQESETEDKNKKTESQRHKMIEKNEKHSE